MKQRGYYLKLLIQEITAYKKTIWLWMAIRVIVKTILPFSRVLMSALVIEWLLTGIEIEQFLWQLTIGIILICFLEVIDKRLSFYFETESDIFRIKIVTKITSQILFLDYPNIQSEEGQKMYAEALGLAGSPAQLFGRIINDLMDLASAVIGIIMYATLILQVDGIFILIIAVMIIGLLIFKGQQKKINQSISEKQAENNKQNSYLRRIYGDLRLAKDIRLYQMHDWFIEIKTQITDAYVEIMRPKNKVQFFENTYLAIGTIILTALAYILSIQQIESGILNVSGFVVYVGAITLLASTITEGINDLAEMDRNLQEVRYYDDFMHQNQVFNHGEGMALPTENIRIELKNVTYTYPNQKEPALRNISMVLNPLEKVAIVGENGAGKSTLVKLICGLLLPDSGEILLNGHHQNEYNIFDYYQLFSTVFQDSFLLTYTIKETIIQGLPYDEGHYQSVLKHSGVDKMVNQFKMGDETKIVKAVDNDAIQLSGGQLQKLKLAQALYKNGPVLILDEPTAALDPLSEHEVYQDYLHFSENKLSLFISHRLASTRFCDRIIYLRDGAIVEVGSHDQLIALKGQYYTLYEAQAHYYRDNIDDSQAGEEVIEVGGVI
ncbi:ABC transporter ATP-binding protein [Fundicoccus culcitae]|uniref:ATP-binding cassette domain-containing protein n=1 Tax=Fundicoccus culcitae TaxID=2969821 RepID=A0ABY5P737_9LACT|nr:ATP-binding cassette domain-containing protein [Fundicoccus culcitae]UUX34248.1 ATP-binding cassette domain-containing protein [Fundicoccus culcitae]